MNILAVLLVCSFQYILLEGLQLAPYVRPPSLRAKFLQLVAARGDVGLIAFVHFFDPQAWASNDATYALHKAFGSFEVLNVRALLALGANVSAYETYVGTALHASARDDRFLGATIDLLDAGAEVDATNSDGDTPLMVALYSGASKTVSVLLHAGATRTKGRYQSHSPVIVALELAQPETIAEILGARPVADLKRYYRCRESAKIESNLRSSLHLSTEGKLTDPLFRTTLHKTCDTCISSAMLAARDLFQRTPLHAAVLREDGECVKTLLESGADPAALDWLQRTPLQIARYCGFHAIVALLEGGAEAQQHKSHN